MKKGKGQNVTSYDKLSTNVTRSYTVSKCANQQPSNLEGSGSERSKRGRKAQWRRARATHHGNKECRKLLDDDEISKTIGHAGLTTTRRCKATDHPTWEAQVYVINIERGSLAKTGKSILLMRWPRKRSRNKILYMKTSVANGVCTECAAYSFYCVNYIFIST